MRDHKIQPSKLYETMVGEPEPIYPHIELPYEIIKDEAKKYQPGDIICVEVHVEIENISEYSIGGKLLKSEDQTDDE